VQVDPEYQPNPLLPETHAELAIPMLFRDQLIGVLDLQAKTVNRFHDEDINILKTLAEQIATAVRNAQLFEEVQRALREAERANSVKSAFLASMSHELRTPLNAVINFTRFVVEGDMGPVNEQQVELLKEVISSAKHLQNLINDVLDMSKIESGSLTLFVEENVNLNNILRKVMTTGTALTDGKPVHLELNAPGDLPLIRADQQRILQILLNIMSNACKFTEEGYIKVAARCIGDEVIVSVEDTGMGIAVQDQPIVFQAFMQTESGLRQGGGTGLGMPISRSLAEAHGGRVWLESELGKGSTFFLALPIKSEMLVSVVLS
jgi:signal transduction histidine kinase